MENIDLYDLFFDFCDGKPFHKMIECDCGEEWLVIAAKTQGSFKCPECGLWMDEWLEPLEPEMYYDIP